jgi:hypothetical protein
MAACAALDPAMAPASYQTASPKTLGSFGNWPNVVAQGVASDAGDIELWDGPGSIGFLGLPPSQVQALAATLAAGNPPVTTGAPDDGSALGFIAPAFASGAPTARRASRSAARSRSGTGGAAFFTGSLSAGAVTIDNGGAISGDGTVSAQRTPRLHRRSGVMRRRPKSLTPPALRATSPLRGEEGL